jgi:predicted metalloprotease with PDZ domain
VRVPAPSTHRLEVEARVPTDGQGTITLRWARWTPGFYRVEDYSAEVEDVFARDPQGKALTLRRDSERKNRWTIETEAAPVVIVSYRLRAERVSVTTNWVGPELGVLNGAATFPTLADGRPRPHEIRLHLPDEWKEAKTALPPAPGDSSASPRERRFLSADYDELVDSPIVAGALETRTFTIANHRFELVDVSPPAAWDGARAASDLERMIVANARIWGDLPFARYVFLNVFRKGRGGLEHRDSTLLTADAEAVANPAGYGRWLEFASHEFVHAYNVKRLRPVELGPFDYESEPRTPSLWISEGLTTYVAQLALARAGLRTREDFLAGMTRLIAELQGQPGRLRQTVERSSLEVWSNSLSGINPAADTVSYYTKGAVLGLLLDAHIRRLTNGARSIDDLLRTGYRRYGGARGFTPPEFRALASEVAGEDLASWFSDAVESATELDYREALAWFGLRFAKTEPQGESPEAVWQLEIDPAADAEQAAHLRALLGGSGIPVDYGSRRTRIGSRRAARRAGTSEARAATTTTIATTPKSVAPSVAETPYSRPATTRRRASARPTPPTQARLTTRSPWPRNCRTMSARSAPSAMRRPTSRRRSPTA